MRIGLILMAYSTTPGMLDLGGGVFVGFGLAGCSFSVVLGAFGKLLPARWRSLAFGAGTAAGSFGQFLYSPLAVSLMDAFGWQTALADLRRWACCWCCRCRLRLRRRPPEQARSMAWPPNRCGRRCPKRSATAPICCSCIGFFTCGFQLAFITVHMPAYLVDKGLSVQVGGWTIAVIGLFNIVGSLTAGWLGDLMPKRYILSFIYFGRALAVLAFISFPVTPVSAITFGAVMGLLWLSTVAPTNGIIALMFGTRWLATLAGMAFFSHQVGGFLGVWLGGVVFVNTGSYDAVWWLSILFGLLSAVINLPIVEKPVQRLATAPA